MARRRRHARRHLPQTLESRRPHDKHIVLEQWESLHHFLAHIASSGTAALEHGASQRQRGAEVPLEVFVQQCRTLQRDDFSERAGMIDRLADTLAGDVPVGVSVRRQPVWGSHGAQVNVHKVLRGDLSHAWRRTIRQTHRAESGALVLVVPSFVAWYVLDDQIRWSAIATLALADYARRAGRRVEIWSIGYHDNVYTETVKDYALCVPLVRAGESWDSSTVCLATYPEWCRRLGFRAMEMSAAREGPIGSHYGYRGSASALLSWARERWAPTQGLDPQSLILGCHEACGVRDHPSAARWVHEQLASLATA